MPEETFNIKSGKIPKMGETPDAESRETEQIANAMEESLKAARILEIVAAQSEQIEYLTFGGGGAKGTAYSGVYSALCEAKIMEGVAAITGSSAGAITAAIIATGIDPINFDKLLKNTDLSLLPGKGMLINKDGNPLYELIAENVAINISRYFKSKDKDISRLLLERNEIIIEELKGLEIEIASKNEEISTTDRELPKFESLSTELNKLEKRQYLLIKSKDTLGEKGHNLKDIINKANLGGEITFGDLGLLNALDPYTFKNLVITAVRRDNGQLTIFNPEDTPNVEIALACRASGSLPLFFKPVIIDGVEYVDGGFRDNNPTKYFSGKERSKEPEQKSNDVDLTESKQKEVQRILIFAFGSNQENDVTHSAIYSAIGKIYNPSKLYKLLVDVMYKGLARVGGQFKYTETIENTAQDLRKKSHDTVILDTPGVGTISFKKANEKYDYLYIKGYIQTMGHVNNHGLGTKGLESVDPNLDHKRMILEVYERSTSNNSWTSKINKKANSDLLSMLETDKWKQPSSDSKGERKPMDEKERRAILETLIISTASRGNTSLCDIKNIAKIVDTLNNKTTSIEVRRDFAKILANSRNDEDIYSRKFKSRDFKELIDRFNKERNNADRKTPQMSLSRNF